MAEVLNRIRKFMQKEGIPGRDAWDFSGRCFGLTWRIEK